MEELFINSVKIELPQRSVSQTLQINDIAEIKDRNADYSNNVRISKTPNNVLTFEMLGIVGALTRLPYTKVDVKYVVDGIELISEGKGVIKNTNRYYNLIIYDGNISMSELLGDARMNELDFTSHNHTLTHTIFTDSFANIDGYIYALGEFFLQSTLDNIIKIDLVSPSFYMHTLFSAIFTEKGHTVSGSILTDTDFKSRLISMNNGFDRFTTENRSVAKSVNSSDTIDETFPSETTEKFEIERFTATDTLTHTVTVDGNFSIQFGTFPRLIFDVNGTRQVTEDIAPGILSVETNVSLSSGDVLVVFIDMISELNGSTQTIGFDYNLNLKFIENDLSIDIDFAVLIGDMKQIDFIKDVMQRFGMIFKKTKNDLDFEFTTMKTVLTDKAGSEDWTDKYSSFVNETYKPTYARRNFLKYKYDDDSANTELIYADGEITVDNVNLDATKTLFTSVFKASTFTNTGYWILNHWVTKEEEILINEDGLGIFKKINNGGSFRFRFANSDEGFITFTGTFPLLNFDSIFYSKEVFNWYREFESMLSNYKFTIVHMNLSVVDIYELDFFKLKYIKQLGQYYYLNKVMNFKKFKKTIVQLIQIGADIVDALAITGTSTGESVVSSTLTKLTAGQMISHITTGSTTMAVLTAPDIMTAFQTSTTGTTFELVCDKTISITRYHDGLSTFPGATDVIFIDGAGIDTFDGGDLFFLIEDVTSEIIRINSSGVVTSVDTCE